jgi:hypothetical protein
MSKLDQIQNELKNINQAKFQKLCDSYLYRVLDAKEIESIAVLRIERLSSKV